MDALHKLVSFRAGAGSVIPHVAVLFVVAWVVGLLAARRLGTNRKDRAPRDEPP